MNISEKDQLLISVLVVALAVGISINDGLPDLSELRPFLRIVVPAFVALFFAFGLHELSHRLMARILGFDAVYRMWIPGLALAVGSAFWGFLFAAPGFVEMKELKDVPTDEILDKYKNKLGAISLAGPLSNVLMAFGFLILYGYSSVIWDLRNIPLLNEDSILELIRWCLLLNVLFGLFNMIPIPPIDGSKIFMWSKGTWLLLALVAGALFLMTRYQMDFLLSFFG
ncbi:M50 family metallopeptidase [Bacteroidota bacterium]